MAGRRSAGAVLLGGAAAIGLAWRKLTRFEIADESMLPTLRPGDYVVAARSSGRPRRGDIVIFSRPGRGAFHLVKRIVGLPGEVVEIKGGRVGVDDAVLAEPWARGVTLGEGRWRLGSDEVFVLSDNRACVTTDGRTLGPLALGGVRWRVAWRYWPAATAGRVT